MKTLLAGAIVVPIIAISPIAVLSWQTLAQQPPPATAQSADTPQPDPDAQNLADSLQNLQGIVSTIAVHRNAVLAYDRKVSATFADQRAQLMWWQKCAAESNCWQWVRDGKS